MFCRVRPIFNSEMKGVIDYIGKDGSLFVLDPSKPQKDARKTFQFNQVFAPTATQGNFAFLLRGYISMCQVSHFSCVQMMYSEKHSH